MPPERTRSSSVHPRALRSPVDDRAKAYGVVVDRSVRRHGELVARSTRVVPSCCRRSYPGHSAPCVHLLVGRGAWSPTVRARAPRVWNIAPRRASTCSEGVEPCSTSCEHALRGSGTLLHVVRALLRGRGTLHHVVRALLRGRGALLHIVRARLQLDRSTEPP